MSRNPPRKEHKPIEHLVDLSWELADVNRAIGYLQSRQQELKSAIMRLSIYAEFLDDSRQFDLYPHTKGHKMIVTYISKDVSKDSIIVHGMYRDNPISIDRDRVKLFYWKD